MRSNKFLFKRDDIVTFRMRHDQHSLLIETAAYHGLSKGDFIRRCVNAFLRKYPNDKTSSK